MLNHRELATVLAALRLWQQSQEAGRQHAALLDIATDGGKFDVLQCEEIDRLCEQLNESSDAKLAYVLYDFDAGELASTLVYRALDSAREDADQLENVVILKLRLPDRDDDSS